MAGVRPACASGLRRSRSTRATLLSKLGAWAFVRGRMPGRTTLWMPSLMSFNFLAGRIGFLPVDRRFKGNMAQAVIFGRGLYGGEVDPATQQQVAVLRRLMAMAIWRDRAVRNRQVVLLLMESGKWEPEAAIAKRMMSFWGNLVALGLWTAETQCYLENGKVIRRSGPIGWLWAQLQRWDLRVDAEGRLWHSGAWRREGEVD